MSGLNETTIERYSRQLLLPGWGSKEQEALFAASVVVSNRAEAAIRYLVGAGVGRVFLTGPDEQFASELRKLNPDVTVEPLRDGSLTVDGAILFDGEPLPCSAHHVLALTGNGVGTDTDLYVLPKLVAKSGRCGEAFAASLMLEALATTATPSKFPIAA